MALLNEFDSHFASLVNAIFDELPDSLKIAKDYLQEVVQYNVPHGKKNRGTTVLMASRVLMNEVMTDSLTKMAIVVGWAIEWMQASFLVHDDIMDHGQMRRGQPCWYIEAARRYPKLAITSPDGTHKPCLIAVNDGIHLLCSTYELLRLHCHHSEHYLDILQLFMQSAHKTSVGQALDCVNVCAPNSDRFSEERYRSIVKWKTAYYSFDLPVTAAIILCGFKDQTPMHQVQQILLQIGAYFQAQDDFLDIYGDPAVIGKVGTDIQEGKCAWPIVTALQLSTEEQRQTLLENYGQTSVECETRVRTLFDELHLPDVFTKFEEESYKTVQKEIEDNVCVLAVREMLSQVVQMIYKRKK